jgi:APA family basic amino acid/polyamine antiporter
MNLINLTTDYNVTSSLVQSPIAWSEDSNEFYVTGQIINLPAIAITLAVTFVLIIGIRETAIVNLMFVIIKVIILLIFIIAGSFHIDINNYNPFFPPNQGIVKRLINIDVSIYFLALGSFSQYGVTGMLHASTFVFFAYVGFESVTAVAQEAKQPSRSMPLALILSLVISLVIYVGVCTVMVGLVLYTELDTTYPLIAAA